MKADAAKSPTTHDLSPRACAIALAGICVFFTLLRVLGRNLQMHPLIFGDELMHMEAARSILDGGGLYWGAVPVNYPNWLYPLLIAPAIEWLPPRTGYRAALVVNALSVGLTIPLTWLLARLVLDRTRALAAAALTGLLVGFSCASLLMAENLYFPLSTMTLWLAVQSMGQAPARNRLLAGAAMGLLYHVKPQGLFFPIFFGIAVLADGQLTPAVSTGDRLRLVARHWLTAVAWALVLALRLVIAVAFENHTDPLSLEALLGSYTGRALGDLPFRWDGFLLMFWMNVVVLVVASGLMPGLALGGSLARLSNRNAGDIWRRLTLLTASGTLVTTVASARHTIVADADWSVYERYLMPIFPAMIVLMLTRPSSPLHPAAKISAWIAALVFLASAAVLARWRSDLLQSNIPSLAFEWLAREQYAGIVAARWWLGAFVLILIGSLLWAQWRGGEHWRRRLPSLATAALLLVFNAAYYATQYLAIRELLQPVDRISRMVRRALPDDARLLLLLDGMRIDDYYHTHLRTPGMGVRLGTATGDEWFSRPLRLSATGIVVPPDDGPWWLMAHQKFPVSRPADASAGVYRLYDLSAVPPLRFDLDALGGLLDGDLSHDFTGDEPFQPGFELTWLDVRLPQNWRAGERRTVRLRVRNDSPFPLLPGDAYYAVGYHWGNPTMTGDWTAIVWDDGRHEPLPDALAPGAVAELELDVQAPEPPHPNWLLTLSPLMADRDARHWAIHPARMHLRELPLLPAE